EEIGKNISEAAAALTCVGGAASACAAELFRELGEIESRKWIRAAACASESRECLASEPVILLALLFIAQHRISLGKLLELVLRFLVALVLVGMKLLREIAIRLLDLIVGRPFFHAEDVVVVAVGHRGQYTEE